MVQPLVKYHVPCNAKMRSYLPIYLPYVNLDLLGSGLCQQAGLRGEADPRVDRRGAGGWNVHVQVEVPQSRAERDGAGRDGAEGRGTQYAGGAEGLRLASTKLGARMLDEG